MSKTFPPNDHEVEMKSLTLLDDIRTTLKAKFTNDKEVAIVTSVSQPTLESYFLVIILRSFGRKIIKYRYVQKCQQWYNVSIHIVQCTSFVVELSGNLSFVKSRTFFSFFFAHLRLQVSVSCVLYIFLQHVMNIIVSATYISQSIRTHFIRLVVLTLRS